MTLLCIGKSGQVARALNERAEALGVACLCKGRPETDILDTPSLLRALDTTQPKFVINGAAYTAVDAAERDQDKAYAINAVGARVLAELCAARDLPLLHLSTDYVFDGSGQRPYREDDAVAPINAYGASKLAGDVEVRDAHRQHVILRTSWVYSPFGANFVKTMLRLAKQSGQATVVDDQFGCPTNALDIADTILSIARQCTNAPDNKLYGTYHYSAGGVCSWADVAAVIFETYEQRTGCKITLKRIPSSDYPTPAKRPLNSRLDTAKIEQVFGVRPQDWIESVQTIANRLIDEGI